MFETGSIALFVESQRSDSVGSQELWKIATNPGRAEGESLWKIEGE
jgi:hypothetical protein